MSDEQWQAICKVLQLAEVRVAIDPDIIGKDIDFAVKVIG